MFVGFSKRVKGGLRLGAGFRITKRNFFYMALIVLVYYISYLAIVGSIWLIVGIAYFCLVLPTKKIIQLIKGEKSPPPAPKIQYEESEGDNMGKPLNKRWYVWVVGIIVISFIIYPFLPDNEEPQYEAAYAAAYYEYEAEEEPPAIEEPVYTPEEAYEPEDDEEYVAEEIAEEPEPMPEAVLAITAAPDEVRRNERPTISIVGLPNTQYSLSVRMASGNLSTAAGLGNATTDANGVVSWSWQIGGQTGAQTITATVTGGGESAQHRIAVIVD